MQIVELPTGFMDWTALHRNLRGPKLESMLMQVKEVVERYHGVLVVNFHNTYINSDTFPDTYDSFVSLLKSITIDGYWIASAEECARWWEYRALTKLDPQLDDSGKITSLLDSSEFAGELSKGLTLVAV